MRMPYEIQFGWIAYDIVSCLKYAILEILYWPFRIHYIVFGMIKVFLQWD